MINKLLKYFTCFREIDMISNVEFAIGFLLILIVSLEFCAMVGRSYGLARHSENFF